MKKEAIAGHNCLFQEGIKEDIAFLFVIGQENDAEALGSAFPDYSFAFVLPNDWDGECSPYEAEPIFGKKKTFLGLADRFIDEVVNPAAKRLKEYKPNAKLVIGGYSLAALFAYYASLKSNRYSGAICCSGSFWYPGFLNWAMQTQFPKQLEAVYFSLGDKESHVKNPVLAKVEEKTKTLEEHCLSLGISSVFALNPGNHFIDVLLRMEQGISWMTSQI